MMQEGVFHVLMSIIFCIVSSEYYEQLNKEVTILESDPVIQRLRQQKQLRQQQQSRQNEENRAGTNVADEKVRVESPPDVFRFLQGRDPRGKDIRQFFTMSMYHGVGLCRSL